MGRAADIEAFAAALDPSLAPFGFRRRKKAQEWVRNYDDLHRDLIHINFGLAIVNPSIAVEYRDISTAVPRALGCNHSIAMLKSLAMRGSSYDFDSDTSVLSKDITEFGLPFFDKLHDRNFVIQSLASGTPADWFAISYSDRIRLLPMLLTSIGRSAQALEFIDSVATEAEDRDQRIPRFDEFAKWIRKWIVDSSTIGSPETV